MFATNNPAIQKALRYPCLHPMTPRVDEVARPHDPYLRLWSEGVWEVVRDA